MNEYDVVAFADLPCIPSGCINVLFWALAKPEYVEGMLIRRAMLRHSKPRNFRSLPLVFNYDIMMNKAFI